MNETNSASETSSFGISIEDISKIMNYPALDKLFDEHNPTALTEIRGKFGKTQADLERVIRQGSKEDAEKAGKVSRAIKITLDFLDNLEELKQQSA